MRALSLHHARALAPRTVRAFRVAGGADGSALLVVRWPPLNAFAELYLSLPSIGLYVALAPLLAAPRCGARISSGLIDCLSRPLT